MKCLACNSDNRQEVIFCEECGTKLETQCPNCNATIPLGKKFCGKCGQALKGPKGASSIDYSRPQSYTPKFLADKILTNRGALEGERKLVTVLFADVANYTGISEELDPEVIHQIMDGFFGILMDEVHKYEGTINQFTGDGVMALFGAPLAHEDHAQRACYAALSIQKAISKYGERVKNECGVNFKLRIGLNSGPVIVGSIGDDLRMDYTAMGDTTNLAARMESLARPGTILIASNTHRVARDFFEIKHLGRLEIKGKAKTQDAYELIRAANVGTRLEASVAKGLTTYVGRSHELQILKDAYKKVKEGNGQLVGIVGEAGVGKSRSLLELRNRLNPVEHTYLEGRCLHYGGGMVYWPILDILRCYIGAEEEDNELIIKKKLSSKLLQFDQQFEIHLPPLQELLSLKIEDKKYPQLNHGQKKIRIFEGLRDILIRASQEKPVVMAVEDLHWIDKNSEEFLGYLIDWIPNSRILMILLYRPEYTHQWGSKSYYSKVGIDQLSGKNSTELVKKILNDGAVVPELKELILGRASGNPLYLEEFTHSLLENDTIQKKNNEYVLTRETSEILVPDTIQGIIAARIDRMEDSLKQIIQIASVIGREFAFRILQIITGMRNELKSQLLNLQGLEFISEKCLFPELEYIFKHALTQEVAYGSLLQKRKKDIHEKIGVAIEELYPDRIEEYYELLAYHFDRGGNKEKTLDYLYLANKKAFNLNAMEDAKDYFDQAMHILDKMPDTEMNRTRRVSFILFNFDVFDLLFLLSEYLEILKRYRNLFDNILESDQKSVYYSWLGYCECWIGNIDQAIQTGSKGTNLSAQSTRNICKIQANVAIQWSYLWKADFDKVITINDDLAQLFEREFHLRYYNYAMAAASLAHRSKGNWSEAISVAQKAIKMAEEFSDKSVYSFAAMILSNAYLRKGDLKLALKYGEYAVDQAPTPGDKTWAQARLAEVWYTSDETDRGIQYFEAIIPMYEAVNWVVGVVEAKSFLGEGYWLAGQYDKAKQILEESIELANSCGMRFHSGFNYRILGEIAQAYSPNQSTDYFNKSISLNKQIKAENELALAYAGYGRLYKRKGNVLKARENLTKALEIFNRLGTLVEPEKIRNELN